MHNFTTGVGNSDVIFSTTRGNSTGAVGVGASWEALPTSCCDFKKSWNAGITHKVNNKATVHAAIQGGLFGDEAKAGNQLGVEYTGCENLNIKAKVEDLGVVSLLTSYTFCKNTSASVSLEKDVAGKGDLKYGAKVNFNL